VKPLTDKIDMLTTELAAVKSELAKAKETMAAKPVSVTPLARLRKPGVDPAALTAAVDVFKAGKYVDAAHRVQEATRPTTPESSTTQHCQLDSPQTNLTAKHLNSFTKGTASGEGEEGNTSQG